MIIKPMTQEEALEIVEWHYEGIYSFYDQDADLEDLEEFIDPNKRADCYYSVYEENELIGYFYFSKINETEVYLGLGLRPNLTGIGKGLSFLEAGINFIKNMYKPIYITLSVACFNERAIKVYKKVGFIPAKEFVQKTNGGLYPFIKMKLDLKETV